MTQQQRLLIVSLASSGLLLVSPTFAQCDPDEVDKVTAQDGSDTDSFGNSVSISGDTSVVGAYQDDDDGTSSGSAYIYVRDGAGWAQQDKLNAADGGFGDKFGFSVAVSGQTALVCAYEDTISFVDNAGSAYVFVRDGDDWVEQEKLTPSIVEENARFGYSGAIYGGTIVVGALGESLSAGAAYVFEREGDGWPQSARLVASDGASRDSFGLAAAIDGDTIIIGAPGDDDLGSSSGSAYIFVRDGGAWVEQAKLTASDGAEFDDFGYAVSLSGDTALVSALADDVDGIEDSGSAYVFVRDGGSWTEQAKLVASDGAEQDYLGGSVSVHGDIAILGVHGDDDRGTDAGSAYVFRRDGTSWMQEAKLSASDGASGDIFGAAVALDDDSAIVGAPWDDDLGGGSGSAYIFDLNCSCPADLDGDGDADAEDFFAYLDLFAAGDDGADIDGDGDIDADDFFAYLDLFAAGC